VLPRRAHPSPLVGRGEKKNLGGSGPQEKNIRRWGNTPKSRGKFHRRRFPPRKKGMVGRGKRAEKKPRKKKETQRKGTHFKKKGETHQPKT